MAIFPVLFHVFRIGPQQVGLQLGLIQFAGIIGDMQVDIMRSLIDTPRSEETGILSSATGLKLRALPHLIQRSNLPKRLRCLATKFRHDLSYLSRDLGC